MIRIKLSALALLCVLVASCKTETQSTRPVSGTVTGIVSDKSNRYNALLTGRKASPKGDIHIIGSEIPARRLAEMFMETDCRDNVSGSHEPDYLPDFAGETVICLVDSVNLTFPDTLYSGREEALKELTVRHVLSCVDTVAHLTPYDLEGQGSKGSAKIIVIADPYMVHYGKFEADTLFTMLNCNVPVISPMDLAQDRILASKPSANVGIMCGEGFRTDGIYREHFLRHAAEAGCSEADCFVANVSAEKDPFRKFMDLYIAAGNDRPIDAIIIEDGAVDIDALKSGMADLISIMNEESMTYRRYISDDFRIEDSAALLIDRCYGIMRSRNLFTHNIAKPRTHVYFSYENPSRSGGYILIPESYVQN